jgi:hypothetical protein
MKKLITAFAATIILTSCGVPKTAETVESVVTTAITTATSPMSATTTTAPPETTLEEATTSPTEETEYKGNKTHEKYLDFTSNQALRNDISDNRNFYDKLMIDDINNDGRLELVYVKSDLKILTYYSDGQIKTLESLANAGGNCACGGAPVYYNENTHEIMIRRSFFDYKDICFYEYTDENYNLIKQYKWGGFTVPLELDEWYESPDLETLLEEENLTFEDLKELDESKLHDYAIRIGYSWKMDQYMFEDEIITEADWDNAISDFKNADGCISLCPYNTDLEFIDMKSKDFSDYVETKLPVK